MNYLKVFVTFFWLATCTFVLANIAHQNSTSVENRPERGSFEISNVGNFRTGKEIFLSVVWSCGIAASIQVVDTLFVLLTGLMFSGIWATSPPVFLTVLMGLTVVFAAGACLIAGIVASAWGIFWELIHGNIGFDRDFDENLFFSKYTKISERLKSIKSPEEFYNGATTDGFGLQDLFASSFVFSDDLNLFAKDHSKRACKGLFNNEKRVSFETFNNGLISQQRKDRKFIVENMNGMKEFFDSVKEDDAFTLKLHRIVYNSFNSKKSGFSASKGCSSFPPYKVIEAAALKLKDFV